MLNEHKKGLSRELLAAIDRVTGEADAGALNELAVTITGNAKSFARHIDRTTARYKALQQKGGSAEELAALKSELSSCIEQARRFRAIAEAAIAEPFPGFTERKMTAGSRGREPAPSKRRSLR
jgi:hypothetical protein